MATLTNGDRVTNGQVHHPQEESQILQPTNDNIAAYLSEALKLTLDATQEELEREGEPLAQAEAASTIERFHTFLIGSRTAFYAQKAGAASQQDGKIRFV